LKKILWLGKKKFDRNQLHKRSAPAGGFFTLYPSIFLIPPVIAHYYQSSSPKIASLYLPAPVKIEVDKY